MLAALEWVAPGAAEPMFAAGFGLLAALAEPVRKVAEVPVQQMLAEVLLAPEAEPLAAGLAAVKAQPLAVREQLSTLRFAVLVWRCWVAPMPKD